MLPHGKNGLSPMELRRGRGVPVLRSTTTLLSSSSSCCSRAKSSQVADQDELDLGSVPQGWHEGNALKRAVSSLRALPSPCAALALLTLLRWCGL